MKKFIVQFLMVKKIIILIGSFLIIGKLIFCSSEKQEAQIQTLIQASQNHTHDIIIYYSDVVNNREDYYTTEVLNHRHKVILNLEERTKLLNRIELIKETEEAMGHKHIIKIRIFDF